MKIDDLLEKYFEGETTCEEERQLRHFFATDDVPERLAIYRPLFACIDQEAEAVKADKPAFGTIQSNGRHRPTRRVRRLYYFTTGIAATLLLCIGLAKLIRPANDIASSYVIIDGKYYDDPRLVQAKALEALDNVSFTDEELKDNIIPDLLP